MIVVMATKQTDTSTRWADLADLVLVIAREIQFRGYSDQRAFRLTQSEGMVMRHLLNSAPATPSQLATATGLQRTNLSSVLRGLESKDLIERHGSHDDRRGVTVHPTDLGRTNYALVRGEWAQAVAKAAANDTTGLDEALGLLTAVRDGLTAARPSTEVAQPARTARSSR